MNRDAMRQRLMQRFDLNHDGILDDNEKAQMRQARQNEHAEQPGVSPEATPGGAGGTPPVAN
jgi:hypothetical protein